jgi:hypothetical protein
MPIDTTETSVATYVTISKERWQSFFDVFTKVLQNRRVEIEVIGLDLGDQIEAEWLPLNGLTYDPKADTFYVYLGNVDRNFDHAVSQPREILVRLGAGGLEQVIVVDAGAYEHIVRLRRPIELPQPMS